MPHETFKDRFMKLIRVGQPAIFITTHEEERCINEIRAAFIEANEAGAGKKLAQFKITTEGIHFRVGDMPPFGDTSNPDVFLNTILEELLIEDLANKAIADHAASGARGKCEPERSTIGMDTTFLLPDYHHFFKENYPDRLVILRKMKDIIRRFGSFGNTLVVIAPSPYLPEDIEKDFVLMDYEMPSEEQIESMIIEFYEGTISAEEGNRQKAFKDHFAKNRRQIVNAFKGLTAFEGTTALAIAVSDEMKGADKGQIDVRSILSHKAQSIKKSGVAEWMDVDIDMDKIGGLEILKEWILKRKKAFGQEAIDFGLPKPRGILLLGCSGTGKSLIAKVTANILSLPLIRVDMGNIFGSLVGESEKNIQALTKLAESIAPCVLMLDEVDKALAGVGGGGNNDSGTTKRVFGAFLTWMQERKADVFVVATANDISHLPPEFKRKGGRFDEIFFVDYPNRTEREQILKIQVANICKTRADADIDYKALSVELENFTGAEIQSIVENAMINAFDEESATVKNHHILVSLRESTKLWDTDHEKIAKMREEIKTQARSASKPDETPYVSKVASLPENTNARKITR